VVEEVSKETEENLEAEGNIEAEENIEVEVTEDMVAEVEEEEETGQIKKKIKTVRLSEIIQLRILLSVIRQKVKKEVVGIEIKEVADQLKIPMMLMGNGQRLKRKTQERQSLSTTRTRR